MQGPRFGTRETARQRKALLQEAAIYSWCMPWGWSSQNKPCPNHLERLLKCSFPGSTPSNSNSVYLGGAQESAF